MYSLRKEIKVILPLFISFFLLYFFTISRCFSLAIDSSSYASDIANGDLVFHPHHLVYHAVFYFWNKLLTFFGSNSLIVNITSINVLFGSLSCVVLYLILKIRFGLTTSKSILLLCLPAFSFGLWMVSTSVNVYSASVLFLLLIFYLYLEEEESKQKWILIGITHSIAVIFNEWNVFILGVLFLSIFLSEKRNLIFRKYYFYYLVPFILITAFSYLSIMVFIFHIDNYKDMHSWLTFYSGKYPWSPLNLTTLAKSLIGIGQTYVTPLWILNSSFLLNSISNILTASVSLDEEVFFARLFTTTEIIFLLSLSLFILAILIYYMVFILKNIKSIYINSRKQLIYLFNWIIISSIMPFFWTSQNQRFWFIQTIVLFLLIALFVSRIKNEKAARRNYYLIFILAVSLFLVNMFGTMIKGLDKNNDLTYCKAKGIVEDMKPGDLVVFNKIYNYGAFINFYRPGSKELSLDELHDKERYNKAIYVLRNIDTILKNNKVYFLEEIFNEKDKYPPDIRKLVEDIEIRYKPNMTYKNFGYGIKAYIVTGK